MQISFDSLPYNARYSIMALILIMVLILVWIKLGKEIRKEQKMKLAGSISIIVSASALYFWLIGMKVIENEIAIFIADVLFAFYVLGVFVAGIFLYLHQRYHNNM